MEVSPLIVEAITRKARRAWMTAAVLAVWGLAILVGAATEEPDSMGRSLGAALAPVFFLAAGWPLLRGRRYLGGGRSYVARLIADRPDEIVWVYVSSQTLWLFIVPIFMWREVVIATRTGERFGAIVPKIREDELIAALAARAPGAAMGYSRARERVFRRHPAQVVSVGSRHAPPPAP